MKKYINSESNLNVKSLAEACVDLIDGEYNMIDWIPAEEYIGGREGVIVIYKEDTNAYRVWIDTSSKELIFQCIRYAWPSRNGEESYDDARDYKDCSIEDMTAQQVFDIIVTWTNECQADDPHYTLYPGDYDPDEGDIIPIEESTELASSNNQSITCSSNSDFFEWYDSLSSKEQDEVDDMADEWGLPLYDECSEGELSQLVDNFNSNHAGNYVEASMSEEDLMNADLYVVKIWHEIDPGHDVAAPVAAEEIIETWATSPQEALDYAKKAWSGPIDRIEIVDVNPEVSEYEDDLPFNNGEYVESSEQSIDLTRTRETNDRLRDEWYTEEYYAELDPQRLKDMKSINWNSVSAEDTEFFLKDEVAYPDLSAIRSVRYFDREQDWADANNYDGGYVVEYKDGTRRYFAWHFGDDDVEDVTSEFEED